MYENRCDPGMIDAMWLFVIVPISACVGAILAGLVTSTSGKDEWSEKDDAGTNGSVTENAAEDDPVNSGNDSERGPVWW